MPDGELDVLQGTLDLLVLRALRTGPMHGYSVLDWLKRATAGELRLEDAALYPALHRLEARGHIESSWGLSENNRRARYYTLTPAGKRHLAAEREEFERIVSAIQLVLANA